MKRIWYLAVIAYKDAIRKKILWVLFLFAIILIFVSVILEVISLEHYSEYSKIKGVSTGKPRETIERMTKDMGIASISLFGMLIILFAAANQIPEELESRTLSTLLTYPIKRREYILGKFLGIFLVLLMIIVLMTILLSITLYIKYRKLYAEESILFFSVFKGIYALIIQLAVLLSIAVMFSTFAPVNFNIIICFIIFLAGHITSYLITFSQNLTSSVAKGIIRVVYAIIPNFEYFNLSNELALRSDVSYSYLFSITVYGFVYIAIMLSIALFVFSDKQA